MLLLRSPFLVARLCSVSHLFKFPAGLTNVSGLAVAAFDLVYYSLSVVRRGGGGCIKGQVTKYTTVCKRDYYYYLITLTETRFLSSCEWRPPPKPCFH